MTKEDKKNAYLYCKFRDKQFSLYAENAKRNGMRMKTLLVINVPFYAKEIEGDLSRTFTRNLTRLVNQEMEESAE